MADVVQVQVSVSKETHELAQALGQVITVVKQALADGWQMGTDLPPVMTAVIAQLVPALQGVEKIKDELGDLEHFANAIYIGLAPELFKLIKKA